MTPSPRTRPYDAELVELTQRIARARGVPIHRGCYLGTLGPTYETRAEYRMFRWAGADAVGMSTIPEVLAAHALGMRALAFSVITNVAFDDGATTSHDEVLSVGRGAAPRLLEILQDLMHQLAGQPD